MTPKDQKRITVLIDAVLYVGAILCLAVLCYVFLNFGEYANGTANILLYFVVPGMGLIGSVVVLFLPFKVKGSIVPAMISVVFTMYVLELALVLMQPTSAHDADMRRIAQSENREVDERDPEELILELKDKGIEAFQSIVLSHLTPGHQTSNATSEGRSDGRTLLPLSNVSRSTIILCKEYGYFVTYESDRHGFRNPDAIWDEASLDMAFVGDSFMEGLCVRDGLGLVDRVRERYPRTINLGRADTGPLAQLAIIIEYLSDLRPKVVVWGYYEGNDISNLGARMDHAVLKRYLEDGFSQGLLANQDQVDRQLKGFAERRFRNWMDARNRSSTLAFLKLFRLRNLVLGVGKSTDEENANAEVLETFRQIMLKARTAVSGWGGDLYFVYLPSQVRYREFTQDFSDDGPYRDQVKDTIRELDIPMLDLVDVFDERGTTADLWPKADHLESPHHYSEQGYKIVAEAIIADLSDRGGKFARAFGQTP